LIALLCFILGIWLWDSYFGENGGYAPGTEEITLIRLDRNLQLAEAMADDPPLLRWLAHAQSPEEAVADGIHSLELLISGQVLGPTGFHAYVALLATRDEAPIEGYLSQLNIPSNNPEAPNWWNIKIASENFTFPQTVTTETIRNRAIFTGSIIWGLGIIGLAFVPKALRCLRYAFRNKTRGYASGWNPSLGLIIFLLATLAWIGFSMVLDLGISQLPGLHPVALILLDTFARILPTLIALGLLFRKVSHVPRATGLNGHVHPPVIIGLFSLLVVIDQFLRWALGRFTLEDPTGGLSYMDSGIFGLVFLIVSACLVAPIAEEILYRGILFRSLANKTGVLAAAVLSSVVFASLHFYDFYGFASVATFGLVCALLYQATGSLSNVVLLHMLYNTSITLPQWTIYHAPL
jgi:membrane protease YdiL (CAAX protease family)|tara:strand:- start:36812 stop:38032 length:1221 start_codon:yes stop_codon:yes gene_type:complete